LDRWLDYEGRSEVLVVSDSDFLWFIDKAIGEMVDIVSKLGDDAANTRPELPGANSPYAILTHCLGVMEFWGGHMVAGRPSDRDRAAEFRAEGSVSDLIDRTANACRQLEADVLVAQPSEAPAHPPAPKDVDLPLGRNQSAVLLHILEELTQHLGHMELTRDVILTARPAGPAGPSILRHSPGPDGRNPTV
jgi:hypothetical protein